MENRIQELTSKIYQEGVEKGAAEARRIIDEANAEKDRLLQEAQSQADSILLKARKDAEELTKNTQSELRLYTDQALEALKTEIVNLISDKLASASVQLATSDKEFMQKIILTLVQEWIKNDNLILETADADSLSRYFESSAGDLLSKGLEIKQVNGRPASFSISPSDGSYKVTFGEEEFKAYFSDFLRPQLIDLLFNQS